MSENLTSFQDWRSLLSAAERAAMLDDIACVSLAVGARLFPEQPWSNFGIVLDSATVPKSPTEQLGFIEHLLPKLALAVAQIEWSPLSAAAAKARAVLPMQARRVTASAWMTHARLGPSRRMVDENLTVLSHDTPENRAIKSFRDVLGRDCRAIAQIAEAEEEAEASARAAGCARRLDGLLGAAWWREVTAHRGDWTQSSTSREIARPEYAHIAQARSDYRKGFGFEWDQPLLTLPPRETWRLYEAWCLLTALQTLLELGWEVVPPSQMFAVRAGRLIGTLAVGESSRMDLRSASGQALTLTYNRTFAEGRESLTHSLKPDITLSSAGRVWILDAKFKPYCEPGEEGADINQMHAYRDAIVGRDGTRQAAAAWCLYAGLTQTLNRPFITYGRGPDTQVGALCLRPGDAGTRANLRRLLAQWLPAG